MNLFALYQCPIAAAEAQCDKHVVKMILETAQMLSTAHRVLGTSIDTDLLYKATHTNHPSSVWIRESESNYYWAYRHFLALCDEYTYRYGKTHLSDTKFRSLFKEAPLEIPFGKLTPPPQCMPDEYKVPVTSNFWHNTICAYRDYYFKEKSGFAVYTNRQTPNFMIRGI